MRTLRDTSREVSIHILKSAKYYGRRYYQFVVAACIYYSRLAHARCRAWLVKNWPLIKTRIGLYLRLTRLNKPIGALLLLWPTLWALWVAAEGIPTLHLFLVFTLGVFLTRSAGCIANDLADKDFDLHVKRTRARPLTTGEISPGEALTLAAILLLLAFLLVLTTNRLTVFMSMVAVLLAVIYPFMKRFTYIPQFFLGLAFSWAIPMAFTAQTGSVPVIAWLLFVANILWVVVYDTIYAMVDREDDLKIGIKSTAILFDDADRTFIGIFQLMFIVAMVLTGIQINADMIYYYFLVAGCLLMIYHQYLIRDRLPDSCFRAFMNNNWLGMVVFGGILFNFL